MLLMENTFFVLPIKSPHDTESTFAKMKNLFWLSGYSHPRSSGTDQHRAPFPTGLNPHSVHFGWEHGQDLEAGGRLNTLNLARHAKTLRRKVGGGARTQDCGGRPQTGCIKAGGCSQGAQAARRGCGAACRAEQRPLSFASLPGTGPLGGHRQDLTAAPSSAECLAGAVVSECQESCWKVKLCVCFTQIALPSCWLYSLTHPSSLHINKVKF